MSMVVLLKEGRNCRKDQLLRLGKSVGRNSVFLSS